MSDNNEQRKLAAIMFTDMVGFSALSQQNEALALELLRESQSLLREQFLSFGGREVKATGDGFLVEFPSALQACQCAVEIQRIVTARNAPQPTERHFAVRVGIHVGDVVHREGDIYGDGVNIAARIEPLAVGGGICLSDSVYLQVHNKLGTEFAKLDSPELKNIDVAMDVYRVVLPGEKSVVGAGERQRQPAGARKMIQLAGIVALVVLVAGGAWTALSRTGQSTQKAAGSASVSSIANQKSVAVLPFVNMSADKNDEYLSDGMTEELLNKLAQVPGLRVPGRTSSFSFKGKTEDGIFRKVGEQLHVSTVLEGSVRKVGDKLRITAQLINVADGYHLWSQTYDRDMKDILAVQTEVAQQVVQVLQVKLGVEGKRVLAKAGTVNPEAHRLYLLGRYHFGKSTQASYATAMQYFNQAVEKDPNYALSYCGLADCYGWMGGISLSGKDAWAKERELAEKALALDPNLADAHLSLGIALASAFDWVGGEREMKRALELNPKLAFASDQLAWVQSMFGRFDQAIENKRRAIYFDPLSLMFNCGLAEVLVLARRYDEAIAQLRKTLELGPNYVAYLDLGWCLACKGDTSGAIAAYQKAKSLENNPLSIHALAYAYARAGNRARAEQLMRDLDRQAKHHLDFPGLRALVCVGLGEKNKALDLLERGCAEQDAYCYALKVNPLFDPLRNEPRFKALLKKIGTDE